MAKILICFFFWVILDLRASDFTSAFQNDPVKSVCDPSNSTVDPLMKTSENKTCYFPFIFENKTYNDCVTNNLGSSKICPITCNFMKDKEFGFCQWERKNLLEPNCANITNAQQSSEPSTQSGTQCVFPFVFRGQCYYDCIQLESYQSWCGSVPSVDLNPKAYEVCMYNRSVIEKPSCVNISQSAPTKFPENVNNNTLCVFPFVFKNECHNDCIDNNDGEYWCSLSKGYYNSPWSYCKYLRDIKKFEVNLQYGIYSIYGNCSNETICTSKIVADGRDVGSSVLLAQNSSKYLVESWVILPQPNRSIIIRTPQACPPLNTNQLSWKFSTYGNVVLEELQRYRLNTRFILNPQQNKKNFYSLSSVKGYTTDLNSYIGFKGTNDDNIQDVPIMKHVLQIFWTFKLEKALDINENGMVCEAMTTPSLMTELEKSTTEKTISSTTLPRLIEKKENLPNNLTEDINTTKILMYVTISISVATLIVTLVTVIVMCRHQS